MSDAVNQPIPDAELLARFVFHRRSIREDLTVKPDVFLPPPDLNLSVTRHAKLGVGEIWDRGRLIASQTKRSLHGRADVATSRVVGTGLRVEAFPLDENMEHAHITGWPQDKPTQKSLAQQLAAASVFRAPPMPQ